MVRRRTSVKNDIVAESYDSRSKLRRARQEDGNEMTIGEDSAQQMRCDKYTKDTDGNVYGSPVK